VIGLDTKYNFEKLFTERTASIDMTKSDHYLRRVLMEKHPSSRVT